MRFNFCLLILSLVLAQGAWAKTELILASQEEMPLAGAEKGPVYGYGVDLLKAIFEPLGIHIVYKVIAWPRANSMAEVGDLDCMLGIYALDPRDPDYDSVFVFSEESIGFSQEKAYTRAGDPWLYKGEASLAGRKVLKLDPQRSQYTLDALLNKQVDVVIADSLVMHALLQTRSLNGFIISAGAVSKAKERYLACAAIKESSSVFIRLFDQGVRSLRKNGTLNTILHPYGLRDWRE